VEVTINNEFESIKEKEKTQVKENDLKKSHTIEPRIKKSLVSKISNNLKLENNINNNEENYVKDNTKNKNKFNSINSLPQTNFVDNMINVNQMTNYFPYPYHYNKTTTTSNLNNPPTNSRPNKNFNPLISKSLRQFENSNYFMNQEENHKELKPRNRNSKIVMNLRKLKRQQSTKSIMSQASKRSISVTKNKQMKEVLNQRTRLKDLENLSSNSNFQSYNNLNLEKSKFFKNNQNMNGVKGKYKSQNRLSKYNEFNAFATQIHKKKNNLGLKKMKTKDTRKDSLRIKDSEVSIKLNGMDLSEMSIEKHPVIKKTRQKLARDRLRRRKKRVKKVDEKAKLVKNYRFPDYQQSKVNSNRDTKRNK
jgi:hypothetical protein